MRGYFNGSKHSIFLRTFWSSARLIECLRFIPDSELRVQYVDDENTLINLRANLWTL